MALVVRWAASGEEVARFDTSAFQALQETGGRTVKALKLELQCRLSTSRFRLRLVRQQDCVEMHDQELLAVPLELKLVVLSCLPPDEEQDELFILACQEGCLEEVERCLQRPQDPNTLDDGWSALHTAAEHGHLEVVRTLLEAQACCNTAHGGISPLHCASIGGYTEVTRLLLQTKVSCDQVTSGRGASPLHWAAEKGHPEVVRLLVEARASCDLSTTDDGSTSLHFAARNGNLESVRLLVDARASLNRTTTDGDMTPLQLASLNGHTELMCFLLTSRASCHVAAKDGRTPVQLAMEHDDVELVLCVMQDAFKLKRPRTDGAENHA